MVAAARIESNGVPVDLPLFGRIRDSWSAIQDRLIERIDADYGVFDGRTFKAERWAGWLAANGVPWPRLPSGALALDDDSFREMARAHPSVAPIRELRVSLSQMRLSELAVGADGRNRCLLSAFRARTGRNQPSNTRFIFGPSVWLRGLIAPDPGWALAYVDWSQQEFGIAAALSGDPAMIAAYESGDPYLTFAKQAGAVPADATKATHGPTREQFKACVLAVQYGMGADSLAARIGQPPAIARDLLRRHRETYRRFWQWSEAAVSYAMLRGELYTVFGWKVRTGPDVNPRMLANFPMQANGAEMLRLACIAATERGIAVCAPVHDAILIEAPAWQIAETVRETQRAMAEASAAVLGGFRLRTEAKVFTWPERYADERGRRMWDTVQAVMAELPPAETCSAGAHGLTGRPDGRCCTGAHPTCSAGAHPVQSPFSLFTEDGAPDADLEPGPAAVADAATAETEAVGTAAASKARRTIPERADSLGLAVRRLVAAGAGGRGGRGAVAAGRADAKANGQAVVQRPGDDARQPLRGPSRAAAIGNRGAGQCGASAGLCAGSDDSRSAMSTAVLPVDWREAYEERAAIMEFDARLPRVRAEALALADVWARWRSSAA
ncbi:MAG TPA: DNA polymerase [Phycisphaerae bacterium]|nr:DNA polymerase [Phycisphaerae bacterium]